VNFFCSHGGQNPKPCAQVPLLRFVVFVFLVNPCRHDRTIVHIVACYSMCDLSKMPLKFCSIAAIKLMYLYFNFTTYCKQ